MKYKRADAKSYAKERMKGIWAATLTPFDENLAIDEKAFRENIRHWTGDLEIDGLFVAGKQGEFFSMSVAERKRCLEIAVEETSGKAGTIMSCSDQNIDVVIDLARHAQDVGSDYVVIHSPVLHFLKGHEKTIYEYYKYISEKVDIGIALWSHPDAGYLLSPELCAQLAGIPNVVAIKYSVPRPMYSRLTQIAGDNLIVSTASEEEWFDNIVELGWRLYLCSSPPFLFQTAVDKRMREYTDLAFRGEFEKARVIRDSLDPVRQAFRSSRPPEKPQAHSKFWQELLGQRGGRVRRPMLELTEDEKATIQAAFLSSGLSLPDNGSGGRATAAA
jgi:4-hydroxy-tetrahydrodipicolinate synthase